jgi:hypothetical protein
MATPSNSQTSKAGLSVPAALIPGDNRGSAKINEDLTMAQANAVSMNDYLPSPTPLESPAVIIQGFTSRSTEYALSVIGILCIVYGIVAK